MIARKFVVGIHLTPGLPNKFVLTPARLGRHWSARCGPAFTSNIAEPLPVRTVAIDVVVASLSLHYFR